MMSRAENATVWFAIINSYAASGKAGTLWKKVESVMKDKCLQFHGTWTGRSGNAAELTFDACMAGYRRFIAVGGDGTVHDVLNGIAGYVEWSTSSGHPASFNEFTIGVIPLGSGNDWIKSYGISKDIEKAVDNLVLGATRPQDVAKVSILDSQALPHEREILVSYMINVGGVGIDARVCERVNALKRSGKRGKILYVTSLINAISERVPARMKVMCDGEEIFEGEYLSIAFGLGRYSGGGMRQTPAAILDDGLIDMTLIPDLPVSRIAREAPRLFTGTFLKVPELVVCKGRRITVMPVGDGATEPVEVDGEVVGRAPVSFEVMPEQINVVVSSSSAR